MYITFILHLNFLTILMAAVQRGVACIHNISNYNIQVNQVIECLETHRWIILKYNLNELYVLQILILKCDLK